jgi:small subunit ribosomal protein S6
MVRKYETMFIVKPTLTQEEIEAKVELIKSTLLKQEANIAVIDKIGIRNLAYKIDKFERGYYVVIYFEAKSSAIKELERIYRITEDIIRFIVIKYERKVEIEAWENMVNKSKSKDTSTQVEDSKKEEE